MNWSADVVVRVYAYNDMGLERKQETVGAKLVRCWTAATESGRKNPTPVTARYFQIAFCG
jgi:hypothetical protein